MGSLVSRLSFYLCTLCLGLSAALYAQKQPNCLAPSNEPLVQAIRDGELDKARAMVKSGAKLNILDQCSANPLWEAIRWNHTDFALELMSAGADPNYPDGGGEALAGAAWMCNLKVAHELLKHGVPVDAATHDGGTALMLAPTKRCAEGAMVQLLLNAGAHPNAKDKNGFNALLAAAMEGDASGAEKLLKAGADPNAKDNYGTTPTSEACSRGEKGHAEVCALLRQTLGNTATQSFN
jgi:cytohesin